jgi:hypothetical protein
MKKLILLVVALILVMTILTVSGCWANAPAQVEVLSPDKIGKITDAFKKYEDPAVPGWIIGVIFKLSYRESYGWRSDPYNIVSASIYLPKGTLTIMPANGYQEEEFVKRFKPGSVIQFRVKDSYGNWLSTFPMGGSNVYRVELEDIFIIGEVDSN